MTKTMRAAIRLSIRPALSDKPLPIGVARSWTELVSGSSPPVRGVAIESIELGSSKTERLSPSSGGRADVNVLYIHGGAFRIGSARMYRSLTASLAKRAGVSVFAPDYRLAPEHPFPTAHDDAFAAARALLARSDARLVIAGDSAGGGLALATAQRLRDENESRIAGIVLVSPWLDMTMSGASATALEPLDPMLSRAGLAFAARDYLRGVSPDDTNASPLFGKLERLPPIHVEVGSDEVLLDDSTRLEARARAAGVPITVEVTRGFWHDFPLHAGMFPEADRAIERIAGFVGRVARPS